MILELWLWLDLWPQKQLVSQFSDAICKSCSNFKSIGWKMTILEIWPQDDLWPQNQQASQLRWPPQLGEVSWRLVLNIVTCRRLKDKQRKKKKRRKRWHADHDTWKIHPPLQRLPWIHQVVHFIKIKIDNRNQSSGQSDENWLFFRLKMMILEVWPWVDLSPFDFKNSWFPNSVMHDAIGA